MYSAYTGLVSGEGGSVRLNGGKGSDGVVTRASPSPHHGSGSNLGFDATCGLTLVLILSLAPKAFLPGTTFFSSLQKMKNSKLLIDYLVDIWLPLNRHSPIYLFERAWFELDCICVHSLVQTR